MVVLAYRIFKNEISFSKTFQIFLLIVFVTSTTCRPRYRHRDRNQSEKVLMLKEQLRIMRSTLDRALTEYVSKQQICFTKLLTNSG